MSTARMSRQQGRSTDREPRPDRERLSQPDLRAMLGTLRAAALTTSTAEAALREAGSGLRASEWDLLVALYAFGPARPAELTRSSWLSVNAPTVHAILGRLEGRELITRTAHPESARGVLVQITDAGANEVEQLFPTIERKLVNAWAGHFSQQELEEIARLMERI